MGAVSQLARPVVALLACALALALTAPEASAQRAAPALDPARRAEAKRHFDRGADLYAQGAYEEAIAEWMRSYEISDHPLIFESVANAQERLGRPRQAREALMRWREAAPREEHELLDRRLRNLDARIARLEEEERAAAEAKARQQEEEDAARRRAAEEEGGSAPADGGSPLVPIGLVVGGVGLGAVVAGVVLGAVAAGERPDEAAACRKGGGASLCLASERDAIESSAGLALAADILWIGGAAAAAAGVALIVVGSSSGGDGAPQAALAPAPGGATLRGSF